MKRKYLSLLIIIIFLFSTSISHAADISVVADSKYLNFDVSPQLYMDRTYVPFRAIFEYYGAKDVNWDQNNQVGSGTIYGNHLQLKVSSTQAMINGRAAYMDTPVILVNGRILVPLRFISEKIGFVVDWDEKNQTVYINSVENKVTAKNNVNSINLNIGMKKSELVNQLGNPNRIEKSGLYYDWYIYNSDLQNYIQVGIYNDTVVAIATNSSNWIINKDIKIGTAENDIKSKYKLDYSPYENLSNISVDNQNISVYWDRLDGNKVSMVKVERKNNLKYQYSQEVERNFERQLLDLTNVFRLQYNKKSLLWHDNLAALATYHCKDMVQNDFFSHTSSNGNSLGQRASNFISSYRGLGENIALGQINSAHALNDLINSEGHRKNILRDDYEYLGTSIMYSKDNDMYYVQNFMID